MAKRRRKNYLASLLLIFFFWTTLVLMIWFVEPKLISDIFIPNSYLPFFINLFLALFFTLAVIFANSKRGLLVSLGIIIFLILRLYRLDNLLNIILIISSVFVLEFYFTRKS